MRRRASFVVCVIGLALTSCTTPASPPITASSSAVPVATDTPPASLLPPPPPLSSDLPTGPGPTSTTTSTPASTAPPLEIQHDALLAPLLGGLAADLQSGHAPAFLASFRPELQGRVGHWFANTAALGVASARFVPADDYSSGATDSTWSFSRTVVLGIRTPYDDVGSLPGIPYRVDVTIKKSKGRTTLIVTGWKAAFLSDPMDCNCKLGVVHTATVAVVFASTDPDLAFWSTSALLAAAESISWTAQQLTGSGLAVPYGHVIFLADKPFRWFLGSGGAPQESNVTVPLSDALGPDRGRSDSDESRIVVMLQGSDGVVIPNDQQGREYVSDVAAHESTHQLMNRNSRLPFRTDDSPPIWGVEGIAVAVEILHRDSLGDAGRLGYPEPYDPADIDPAWLRAHLSATMPTRGQLYSGSAADSAGYYALAGSVFLYLDHQYDYATMMQVAEAMYTKVNQDPLSLFPDPVHPGAHLSPADAVARWKAWFTGQYLG